MGEFLAYSLVSGLILAVLYLTYKVFLSGEKMHNYNRGILLGIYMVSFGILPSISLFQSLRPINNNTVLHTVNISMQNLMGPAEQPVWGTVLIWIFIGGMGIVAYRTAITWSRLLKTIRNGQKIIKNGYTLVLTDNEKFAPFSWMKYVVISRNDYTENGYAITTHELRHISCRHWIDLLIAQTAAIINWFNPAIWLMRDELTLIHEYQADMAVIDSGTDLKDYQILLIKKAVGSRFPSLANSLNHSKLKKRITMMYKEKPSKGHRLKALTLVPMLALALTVTAVPSVRAAISTISSSKLSVSKDSENIPNDNTSVTVFTVKNLNNHDKKTTVTIKAEGLGDHITVSGGTFTTMGKTYQARSLQCTLTDGVANITAIFPFITEFDHSSMTLNINGEEIPFDLENFFNKAH